MSFGVLKTGRGIKKKAQKKSLIVNLKRNQYDKRLLKAELVIGIAWISDIPVKAREAHEKKLLNSTFQQFPSLFPYFLLFSFNNCNGIYYLYTLQVRVGAGIGIASSKPPLQVTTPRWCIQKGHASRFSAPPNGTNRNLYLLFLVMCHVTGQRGKSSTQLYRYSRDFVHRDALALYR